MLSIGAFAFANAWLLAALAALPVLWWLLRVTPPAPRVLRFPAVRLLFGLKQEEETPAHTPLWLLLLRILLAALLIIGLAHPLLNPRAGLTGEGPLLLVVDNDWAAARRWEARQRALDSLIVQASRNNRPVVVLPTAPPQSGEPVAASDLLRAADARELVQALEPLPWPADRGAALRALEAADLGAGVHPVWVSNGLAGGDAAAADEAEALAARLAELGDLRLITEADGDLARLVKPPVPDGQALRLELMRASSRGEETLSVAITGDEGHGLGRREVVFPDGSAGAELRLELPLELRNRIERIAIEGEPSAGAAVLLDERWRRRPVGMISGEAPEQDQPLLSELYYLGRALAPYSEVRRGTVSELLGRELAVVILPDGALLTEDQRADLAAWIERGGLLLRFAGLRLAAGEDELVPVKLRSGDRTFGGAMSWTRPLQLAQFEPQSPFAGLEVPDDVLVSRQVLAEPAADLASKTWARLRDGTPLVTAAQKGRGTLVLVHTSANTEWSNLSISGLFVNMLRRVVDLSQGVAGAAGEQVLPPLETMDGFGRMRRPPALAAGISEAAVATTVPGPRHPPGLYGNDSVRRALNLSGTVDRLEPLAAAVPGVPSELYGVPGEVDLRPAFLFAALALGLLDLLISFGMRGLFGFAWRGAAAAVLLVMLTPNADAQQQPLEGDEFAAAVTTTTRLAYVETGDATVDEVSRNGLVGLSRVLFRRTAVELGEPVGVDVEGDELAFFPLLYWPVVPEQAVLSAAAASKVSDYMRQGGIVLFDTRDQQEFRANDDALRRLLRGLTIPSLEPVPPEHVLTKAFYLLQRFPGRWAGGRVWIEQRGRQANDGVSPIIIGSNDWAAAWAVDDSGRHMFPAVPGGESQREQAYRFGVNVVMYALTGNYKADQVHVPTILRRLGQ